MKTTRRSTIVIVEESAAVQDLVEQVLREGGDRVLVCQNPLEVLDVARRVRIDLLVTDLDSWSGLVEQVRTSQPDLRVLYLSSGTDGKSEGLAGSLTLRTPFSLDELRAAIVARLNGSGPEASVGAGTAP